MKEMKLKSKRLLKALLLFILITLTVWIACIAKCEYITARHIGEFKNIEEIQGADKVKILSYSDSYAEIYCIFTARSKNDSYMSGNRFGFTYKNGQWISCGWDTIWSERGSADGFVWPYIR